MQSQYHSFTYPYYTCNQPRRDSDIGTTLTTLNKCNTAKIVGQISSFIAAKI